jgi:hypothetical protein
MTESKLRVTEVSPADPNHVHNPTDPGIAPNSNHEGLRVIDHGKHELVPGHPARRHPQSAELAALGTLKKD